MTQMIRRATITHYKSVSEATLEFGPLNVIVGTNGVGKSNIVDALYFLHDAIMEDLDTAITRRHGITSIRQYSKYRPFHIGIDIEVQNKQGEGRYRVILGSTRGSYKVIDELGEWFGSSPIFFGEGEVANGDRPMHSRFTRGEDGHIDFTTEHNIPKSELSPRITVPSSELAATTIAGPSFSIMSYLLQPLTQAITSFTTYSIYPNTLREPRVVSRQEQLSADGSNLASILKQINRDQDSKDSMISALKIVLPELSDIQVRSAGGYYVPVVKVGTEGDGHFFNMSQISDGTLRVLGLLTSFYQPHAPNIIALEEPEQMINPGLLPVIVDAASEFLSSPRHSHRQVFITTHSPSLLDLVEPESIIWTKLSHGVTTCGPITPRQLRLVKENLFTPSEIMLSEGFLDQ